MRSHRDVHQPTRYVFTLLFIVHHNHASSIDRSSYELVRTVHAYSKSNAATRSPRHVIYLSHNHRVFKNEIIYNDKSGARENSYDVHSTYSHDMHQVQTHVKVRILMFTMLLMVYTWSTYTRGDVSSGRLSERLNFLHIIIRNIFVMKPGQG